ncbi:MAG TPA: phage/plasmid primase, P4 family [Smithellaceae bacterium]|jgi:putative DNA primase/helicase|nr:phage/plasmid primase, P4 family [Smithellaceae bacterium]HQF84196.1 phage/plasmid primase, P4 family [Smithellaceae bacterium]HQG79482.1 phage/plasmid primase, P4 family [Smithellaceae bacterium]
MVDPFQEISEQVNAQVEAERQEYAPGTPEAPEAGSVTEADTSKGIASEAVLDALERNEDGDAQLYVELNRGCFLYDAAAGCWYVCRGHYWEKDTLGEAIRAIDDAVEVYAQELQRQAWRRAAAEKAGRSDDGKKHAAIENALAKRIRALQTVNRKQNVLTLARTGRESLAMPGDGWDINPWLLGCLNGVIDLQTGKLETGSPDDLIKTIAPVEYHGIDTPAPTFERFVSGIFNDVVGLIQFIQRLLGYGISGCTNYHCYPIFYGPQGRNGKGTLLEVVKFVLGDLAHKARSETLMESRHVGGRGSADSDTLALRGKRLVWASETSEGRRLNASRIKELCGGDTLTARAVYGREPVEFQPTHLLILLTNERPAAPAHDAALWERIFLVPFEVRFVDEPTRPNEYTADHGLLEKLKKEASGILAWLVRGCLAWQEEGLNPPEIVKAATREYRQDEDLIERFLNDKCIVGAAYKVQAGELYQAYQDWAGEMGLRPVSGIKFGKEMQARFDSYRKRHVFYIGIGLTTDSEGE